MAEKLCTLRKKGGGQKYTETSLWTNPSPSTNFSGQTVTLSQGMSNFKYIGIKYKTSKTQTESDAITEILTVDDFNRCGAGSTSGEPQLRIGGYGSYPFVRLVNKASDTSITFSLAYRVNAATNLSEIVIPLEILGLNELDHGKRFDETTLWTNANPTSSFAQQNITLSDSISNYDYVRIYFRASTTNSAEKSIIFPVSEISDNNNAFGAKFSGFNNTTERVWAKASDTSFTIYLAYQLQQAAQTASSTVVIPTKITGIVVQ